MSNIYQRAISRISGWTWNTSIPIDEDDPKEILQELVDRATPKLVLKQWDEMRNCTDFYRFDCPNCESNISKVDRNLMYKFCPFCGQVLDWEDLQNAKM